MISRFSAKKRDNTEFVGTNRSLFIFGTFQEFFSFSALGGTVVIHYLQQNPTGRLQAKRPFNWRRYHIVIKKKGRVC